MRRLMIELLIQLCQEVLLSLLLSSKQNTGLFCHLRGTLSHL